MSLTFKKKEEKPLREEFRILSTQIETINQQLASGTSGGGPNLQRPLSQINARLQYLHKQVQDTEGEFSKELRNSVHELKEEMRAVSQQLGDSQQALLQDVKEILAELVGIYREEMTMISEQGDSLKKRVEELEKRLG